MKPKTNQTVEYKGRKGQVMAFYFHNGYYYLNLWCKDHTENWTYLTEEDLENIHLV